MMDDSLEGHILTLNTNTGTDQQHIDLDNNVLVNGEYYMLQESKTDSNVMTLVLNPEQMASGAMDVKQIATSASQFIEKAISQEGNMGGIPPDIVIRVDTLPSTNSKTSPHNASIDVTPRVTIPNTIDTSMASRFVTSNVDTIKSSPSSPTFCAEENLQDKKGVNKRQRSYSDSGDQLSAQDRACLEEIERGSQLTPEDQELFEDLSKNKFDFSIGGASLVNSKNDILNSLSLEANMRQQVKISKNDVVTKRILNYGNNKTGSVNNALLNNSSAGILLSGDLNLVRNQQLSATYTGLSSRNVNRTLSDTSLNIEHMNSSTVKEHVVSISGLDSLPLDRILSQSSIPVTENSSGKPIVVNNSVNNTGSSASAGQEVILNMVENPVPSAAPQTIKQVVVHIGGKEQVFDLPQIDGGQFTVHPITMFTTGLPGQQQHQVQIQQQQQVVTAMPTTATEDGPLVNLSDNSDVELFAQDLTSHFRDLHDPINKVEATELGCIMVPMDVKPDTESAVNALITTSNSVDKPYMCAECGVMYTKPSKLRLHIMSKHTGERPFKCSYPNCEWAFTAKFKLMRHLECHQKKDDGIKEYQCPIPKKKKVPTATLR